MTGPEQQSKLVLQDRTLAVFVDDTGHEALVKWQPVYGLGGCAALGRDIERIINQPWKDLRRRVTGSCDTQLHAHKFSGIAKAEDLEAAAQFFRAQPTTETTLLPEISLMQTMKGVLQKRIQDIVEGTLCKEVSIVFESSERTNDLIQKTFQQFDFNRGSKHIPAECSFMPKVAGEPALEVADFVMHAIGRQARHNLTQRGNFLPDFCAVFHAVAPNLTSFMEVETVAHQ